MFGVTIPLYQIKIFSVNKQDYTILFEAASHFRVVLSKTVQDNTF